MEEIYDKYGKKKVYTVIAILLIIANIITIIGLYKVKTSFAVYNVKFRYISHRNGIIIYKDNENNEVVINAGNYRNYGFISPLGSEYEIRYKDKVINVVSSYLNIPEITITISNGDEYRETLNYPISTYDQYGPLEVKLVHGLNSTYYYASQKSAYVFLEIFIALIILLGLASIMYPEKMWRIEHFLSVHGGEPTEFAIFMNQLSGFIIIVMAFIIPFRIFQ